MPHPYIRIINTVYAYSIIRFLSCKILFIIQSDVSDVAEKRRKMRPFISTIGAICHLPAAFGSGKRHVDLHRMEYCHRAKADRSPPPNHQSLSI